jgi:hypothetical protein
MGMELSKSGIEAPRDCASNNAGRPSAAVALAFAAAWSAPWPCSELDANALKVRSGRTLSLPLWGDNTPVTWTCVLASERCLENDRAMLLEYIGPSTDRPLKCWNKKQAHWSRKCSPVVHTDAQLSSSCVVQRHGRARQVCAVDDSSAWVSIHLIAQRIVSGVSVVLSNEVVALRSDTAHSAAACDKPRSNNLDCCCELDEHGCRRNIINRRSSAHASGREASGGQPCMAAHTHYSPTATGATWE